MCFKLAFRNMRRSMRDFTVYFITLMLGVSIFYVFNSIEAQQAMLIISDQQLSLLQALTKMMGYVSAFVAVVLGFLTLYANRFLIRRRKKELGMYTMLGMEREPSPALSYWRRFSSAFSLWLPAWHWAYSSPRDCPY